MRRKYWYYMMMLLFAAAVVIAQPDVLGDRFAPLALTRNRSAVAVHVEDASTYYVHFTINPHPAGNINCYIPVYDETDISTVRIYADVFRMRGECEETDEAYIYSGDNGTLTVYKHIRHLRYEAPDHADTPVIAPLLTDPDIIERATAFMDSHFLSWTYEEARLFFDGQEYTVTYIDRIGNIKNYAFNNVITLDAYGRVIRADYYFIKYERLSACRIKSMREAFDELPQSLPEGIHVNLNNGQLVYTYENSIVQPAYFFEGEASGGKTFECFVKAAVLWTNAQQK